MYFKTEHVLVLPHKKKSETRIIDTYIKKKRYSNNDFLVFEILQKYTYEFDRKKKNKTCFPYICICV